MNINFDLNRAYWFVKIVDAGNITRAALHLNEPKAKLSRNLALLERELGVQLIYRTTRQFKLTDTGLHFYQTAKEHIEGIIGAAGTLKEEGSDLSGTLKITASDDIGIFVVTKIVNEFSSIYPQVSFDLIYTNELLDLVKMGVDIAVRVGHLKDSSLIQKRAGHVKFILATSSRYLNKHKTLTSPDELPQHQTIGFSSRSNMWDLHSKNKTKKIKLNHKFVSNNFIAIRDLVLDGHGIAFLPKFLCEPYLASGEMIHILKQWGDDGSPIQLAVPHQKNISKRARTFMDFASKKLAERF